MGGGFGTEDPTLTESDFEMKTRSDIVKYSYVTGRVTDAAMKEGATAYPPRDYWSIASENAINSSRSIRERSMLGVTRNPQTIASNNVYEAATSPRIRWHPSDDHSFHRAYSVDQQPCSDRTNHKC